MRIPLHILILFVLLTASSCKRSPTSAPSVTATGTTTAPTYLHGHIVLASNQSAVAGATLASQPRLGVVQPPTSDHGGDFTFPRPAADFYLHVQSPDHTFGAIVHVTPDAENITVSLLKTATAHGRLIDAAGKPITHARIVYGKVIHAAEDQSRAVHPGIRGVPLFATASFGGRVNTDDNGRFVLNGLVPENEYSISMITREDNHVHLQKVADITAHSARPIDLGDVTPAAAATRSAGRRKSRTVTSRPDKELP